MDDVKSETAGLIWRLYLLKMRLGQDGLWLTIRFYMRRITALLFCRIIFGRGDVKVPSDARLGGLRYIKIGQNFTAGRGLWMEAICRFPATGQNFAPELIIGDR
ncbi:hypothetical protein FZ041_13960, partial [Selenomonas caprae]